MRLDPDKVRGVDSRSKEGQEKAMRSQKWPKMVKRLTKDCPKVHGKDSVWTNSRCYLFRDRDINSTFYVDVVVVDDKNV